MDTPVTSPEPGLRERKKEATRQALHEAAVRLAVENGLENLTVEAIADAVGVSRRTFSNYFDGKGEALLYGDQRRVRRLLGLVDSRPATEEPWTALTAAARELFAEEVADPRWASQLRLLRRHPSLLTEQVAAFATAERALAARIAARLPEGPDAALLSRLMAATFLTTLRVTVQHWLDHPEPALAVVLDAVLRLARPPATGEAAQG